MRHTHRRTYHVTRKKTTAATKGLARRKRAQAKVSTLGRRKRARLALLARAVSEVASCAARDTTDREERYAGPSLLPPGEVDDPLHLAWYTDLLREWTGQPPRTEALSLGQGWLASIEPFTSISGAQQPGTSACGDTEEEALLHLCNAAYLLYADEERTASQEADTGYRSEGQRPASNWQADWLSLAAEDTRVITTLASRRALLWKLHGAEAPSGIEVTGIAREFDPDQVPHGYHFNASHPQRGWDVHFLLLFSRETVRLLVLVAEFLVAEGSGPDRTVHAEYRTISMEEQGLLRLAEGLAGDPEGEKGKHVPLPGTLPTV